MLKTAPKSWSKSKKKKKDTTCENQHCPLTFESVFLFKWYRKKTVKRYAAVLDSITNDQSLSPGDSREAFRPLCGY